MKGSTSFMENHPKAPWAYTLVAASVSEDVLIWYSPAAETWIVDDPQVDRPLIAQMYFAVRERQLVHRHAR